MADIHNLPTAAQPPVVNVPRRGRYPRDVVALKARRPKLKRREMQLTPSEAMYVLTIRAVRSAAPGNQEVCDVVTQAMAAIAVSVSREASGTFGGELTPVESRFIETIRAYIRAASPSTDFTEQGPK